MVEGRCMKCKKQVEIIDGVQGTTSRGTAIYKGKCGACGTTVCRMGGAKSSTPYQEENIIEEDYKPSIINNQQESSGIAVEKDEINKVQNNEAFSNSAREYPAEKLKYSLKQLKSEGEKKKDWESYLDRKLLTKSEWNFIKTILVLVVLAFFIGLFLIWSGYLKPEINPNFNSQTNNTFNIQTNSSSINQNDYQINAYSNVTSQNYNNFTIINQIKICGNSTC
jgi:hypothetical protein